MTGGKLPWPASESKAAGPPTASIQWGGARMSRPMKDWWRQRLTSPRAPLGLAALGAVLCLPACLAGFLLDDFGMANLFAEGAPAWDVFDFRRIGTPAQMKEAGFLGWWGTDEMQLAFFRPISSLSHALDFALWPRVAWLMHVENALLYGGIVALAGVFFRRLGLPALTAGLAVLLFAVDDVHAQAVGWISNRNALWAALLGVTTLVVHHRWRGGWGGGAVVAPATFATALLAGESGLAWGGYLAAHALFLERGPLWRRVAVLLPYAVVVVAWQLAYRAAGYGAVGSGIYLDVGAHPFLFAWGCLRNMLAMGMAQLSLPVATPFAVMPVGWGISAAVLLGFGALIWPLLRDDPRARFLAAGALLAAAPFGATLPSDRLLLPLGVGGSGLVALVLVAWREGSLSRPGLRPVCWALVAAHLVLSPLMFVPSLFFPVSFEVPARQLVRAIPDDGRVVIVNLPLDLLMFWPEDMRQHAGEPWPERVYLLHGGTTPIEVTGIDDRTLEIHAEAGWMPSPLDRMARSSDLPVIADQWFALEEMGVEVLEVTADGRPTRARFHFQDPLTTWRWITWEGDEVVPFVPPAPSETVRLQASLFGM